MDQESRASERVSIMTEVEIDVRGDVLSVTTLDLGDGGLSVWAPYASPGGPVRVRLPLDDNLPPLEVAGRIAREYQSDGGSVWGIAFEALDPRDKARLQAFLAKA
jgi:hypothetical protein